MNKINFLKMSKNNCIRWAFDFGSWHPNESQWLLASSCIQQEEKERIGKFVFKRDAKSSMVGRLLIRKFIASHSDLKYNEIILKRDDRGKPYVDNESVKGKLNFSVSHHGRFAVLAGQTDGSTIGIDIMATKYGGGKDLNDFFRLMYRHFSPVEWDIIKNTDSSNDVKMLLFNRFWALKESYVKATGTGIVVDLRLIEFKIKTKRLKQDAYVSDTELYLNNVKQEDWVFHEILLDSEHIVAVAVNLKQCESSPFVFLNFEQLMNESMPLLNSDLDYCKEFLCKDEEPY